MTHIFFVCLFIHLAFGCQNTRLLAKKDYSFSLFQFRRNVYRVRMNLSLCRYFFFFFLCTDFYLFFPRSISTRGVKFIVSDPLLNAASFRLQKFNDRIRTPLFVYFFGRIRCSAPIFTLFVCRFALKCFPS